MATTTNYGWTTPDDTALVKDGAAAIRTLGSSVDTTTKALNPSTTLGDIEYRSSTADTNTRLGVGTTGQVLTVAGGVPSWATPTSGGMTLISTTTISAQATVTLSSIPQTYNSLYLVIQNFKPATDSSGIGLRFNGDSANRYLTSANTNTTSAFGSSYIDVSNNNIDNSVATSLDTFFIPDYTNVLTWKLADILYLETDATTTTSANIGTTFGAYNQTAAISSISLISRDGGNITSGTVLLYGVK
jgi:hypothetical protein